MKVQMDGWSISYTTAGEGIPLLFIHGYPLSRRIWEPQVPQLASHARIIMPDLRGHGDSNTPGGSTSIEMFADDCVTLIGQLGITQPVIVCGLSMGGYVALAMLRKYAARIAGLILTSTRASSDSAEAKANRDKAMETAQKFGSTAITESMLPKMFAPSTYENDPNLVSHLRNILESTSVPGIIGALQAMKDRPSSVPMLSFITKPILIIHGDQDQLIPLEEAKAMNTAIPGSELVVMHNAGHLLNMEQAMEFNGAVYQFMKRIQD